MADGWAPFWRYQGLGRYGEQFEHLFEYFPREQVHVLRYRQLIDEPAATLDGIAAFLGVEQGLVTVIPGSNLSAWAEPGPVNDALSKCRAGRSGGWQLCAASVVAPGTAATHGDPAPRYDASAFAATAGAPQLGGGVPLRCGALGTPARQVFSGLAGRHRPWHVRGSHIIGAVRSGCFPIDPHTCSVWHSAEVAHRAPRWRRSAERPEPFRAATGHARSLEPVLFGRGPSVVEGQPRVIRPLDGGDPRAPRIPGAGSRCQCSGTLRPVQAVGAGEQDARHPVGLVVSAVQRVSAGPHQPGTPRPGDYGILPGSPLVAGEDDRPPPAGEFSKVLGFDRFHPPMLGVRS